MAATTMVARSCYGAPDIMEARGLGDAASPDLGTEPRHLPIQAFTCDISTLHMHGLETPLEVYLLSSSNGD
jgi:hypothetical protein